MKLNIATRHTESIFELPLIPFLAVMINVVALLFGTCWLTVVEPLEGNFNITMSQSPVTTGRQNGYSDVPTTLQSIDITVKARPDGEIDMIHFAGFVGRDANAFRQELSTTLELSSNPMVQRGEIGFKVRYDYCLKYVHLVSVMDAITSCAGECSVSLEACNRPSPQSSLTPFAPSLDD